MFCLKKGSKPVKDTNHVVENALNSLDQCLADSNASFLRAARAGNLEKVLEYLKGNIDINISNANGLNALHLAAKEGHVDVVTELLKKGANVNAATKKGNTALHIASLAGQEEVVKVLVNLGANVNVQSQNGFTPLYMAAQENHDTVVSFLLANGANQSLATEDGFTPLAVALQQGHDKVVAVLLENDTKGRVRLPALHIAAKKDDCKAATLLLQNDHNPDVTSKSGFTPLHIAAHYGNEKIANILLDKGADINYSAKHQITPLHVASKWGKLNMVTLLTGKEAEIEAVTRDGLTPLHCAARSGHDQVVDFLLEKGAPILAKTKNGLTPLHMASQGDHIDSARILLYYKAPVDDVTVDYLTALHVAAHCGHVKVAKLLLDRKADPDARALNGFTPLHIACKKNRIKVVELLLKHGASIEATTESGLSPLHVASFMGCMNIVIYLIQSGANPDMPTVRGETPLHLAARANQIDIIRILLRNGANVDARAREEQTPLHIAARLGNVDIVSLLLQHGSAVDATTKDMYTALHIAAKEGQEEVASVLLDHNASLTAATKRGFTPLHLAAKYGNIKVVRLLLQKDAPVDAQGKNGLTPLHVSAHYNHVNEALLILEKGASPHVAAKNGYTPLHIAAKKNQMDIATALLEYGAKCSAESKAGYTPLHLSSQEGHTDMTTLLIEHQANVNCKSNNGLTPLHLCAQEDRVDVASLLVKNGAEIGPQTNAGYTPLHVASHFGQLNMVRFLLRNKADVRITTEHGYTPLHQAAQQGHVPVINLLLENNASPNATTLQGQTPLSIAQRLGYISVMETLKVVTETTITTTTTTVTEEKYKVVAPEIMQETFVTDSEDEGGEDTMLGDQSYRYLTADELKSLGDDSLPIDVTKDEKQHEAIHMAKDSAAPMVEEDKLSPQHITPIEVGFSEKFSPDNIDISRAPVHAGFLVSFMVDARGGAMRGCRHSGVRVIIPPRKAAMPMRITCRYLRKEKLVCPPPLMEGEACASRILEVGPVGARFLGPVIIEVPHFASLRSKEREITILRSDTGENWREHSLEASEEAVQDVLNESFEGDELSALEDLNTNRITRILTTDFPQYFAIVTRIRQEVHSVGPEGGMVSSTVVPQVQAVFPEGALQKKIRVGLQAQPVAPELVSKLLGNRVAVSPIVTVEPRRRKFHKPITLTIPVPQAATKGMINQYSGDAPTLRLLCSITGSTKSGGSSKAQWEDVTGSTPLTFVNDCVSFTTTVSARFWLMDCRQVNEVTRFATELYQEAIHVPFMAKFVVFAKRHEPNEAQLRVFCMSDDKEDKTLETQEHFTEIAKSRDVEVLEEKLQHLEFAGNLVPVTNSGEQLKFAFQAFHENRLPFTIRMKDPHVEPVGRIAFMREPKISRGEPPQTPICNLNIAMPDVSTFLPLPAAMEFVTLEKKYDFMQEAGLSKPESIHRANLRLSDIARELDKDWVELANALNVPQNDVLTAKSEFPDSFEDQALVMLRLWFQKYGSRAAGNELEKGLCKINREDVIKQCMFNIELVTDSVEKAVAKVQLDQSGFDVFKEELGSSREASVRRPSPDVSYEQDIMKQEAESAAETSSETGSLFERDQTSQPFSDEKAEDGQQSGSMVAMNDFLVSEHAMENGRDFVKNEVKAVMEVDKVDENDVNSDINCINHKADCDPGLGSVFVDGNVNRLISAECLTAEDIENKFEATDSFNASVSGIHLKDKMESFSDPCNNNVSDVIDSKAFMLDSESQPCHTTQVNGSTASINVENDCKTNVSTDAKFEDADIAELIKDKTDDISPGPRSKIQTHSSVEIVEVIEPNLENSRLTRKCEENVVAYEISENVELTEELSCKGETEQPGEKKSSCTNTLVVFELKDDLPESNMPDSFAEENELLMEKENQYCDNSLNQGMDQSIGNHAQKELILLGNSSKIISPEDSMNSQKTSQEAYFIPDNELASPDDSNAPALAFIAKSEDILSLGNEERKDEVINSTKRKDDPDFSTRRVSRTPPPSPADVVEKSHASDKKQEEHADIKPEEALLKEVSSLIKSTVNIGVLPVEAHDGVAKMTESETWPSVEMDTSQVSVSSLPDDEKSEPTAATVSSATAEVDADKYSETQKWTEVDESGMVKHLIQRTTHMTLAMHQKSDDQSDEEGRQVVSHPCEELAEDGTAPSPSDALLINDEETCTDAVVCLNQEKGFSDADEKSPAKDSEVMEEIKSDTRERREPTLSSKQLEITETYDKDPAYGSEQVVTLETCTSASGILSAETDQEIVVSEGEHEMCSGVNILPKDRVECSGQVCVSEEPSYPADLESDLHGKIGPDDIFTVEEKTDVMKAVNETRADTETLGAEGSEDKSRASEKDEKIDSFQISHENIFSAEGCDKMTPVAEHECRSDYLAEPDISGEMVATAMKKSDGVEESLESQSCLVKTVEEHALIEDSEELKQIERDQFACSLDYFPAREKFEANENITAATFVEESTSGIISSDHVATKTTTISTVCTTKRPLDDSSRIGNETAEGAAPLAFDNSAFVGAELIDACAKTTDFRSRSPYEVIRSEPEDTDQTNEQESSGISTTQQSDVCYSAPESSDVEIKGPARWKPLLQQIPSEISEEDLIETEITSPVEKCEFMMPDFIEHDVEAHEKCKEISACYLSSECSETEHTEVVKEKHSSASYDIYSHTEPGVRSNQAHSVFTDITESESEIKKKALNEVDGEDQSQFSEKQKGIKMSVESEELSNVEFSAQNIGLREVESDVMEQIKTSEACETENLGTIASNVVSSTADNIGIDGTILESDRSTSPLELVSGADLSDCKSKCTGICDTSLPIEKAETSKSKDSCLPSADTYYRNVEEETVSGQYATSQDSLTLQSEAIGETYTDEITCSFPNDRFREQILEHAIPEIRENEQHFRLNGPVEVDIYDSDDEQLSDEMNLNKHVENFPTSSSNAEGGLCAAMGEVLLHRSEEELGAVGGWQAKDFGFEDREQNGVYMNDVDKIKLNFIGTSDDTVDAEIGNILGLNLHSEDIDVIERPQSPEPPLEVQRADHLTQCELVEFNESLLLHKQTGITKSAEQFKDIKYEASYDLPKNVSDVSGFLSTVSGNETRIDDDFEIIDESECDDTIPACDLTIESGMRLRKMGSFKDITTVHLSHVPVDNCHDLDAFSSPLLPSVEGGERNSNFAYGMQFERDMEDHSEEAMDIDSDNFSDEKELAYSYGMRFEREHELEEDDDIPSYGDLYTHHEEDEEASEEMDKEKLLAVGKTDFDILAGRKFFTKSNELDDLSMSSLQEFERLEEEIRSGRRSSVGSVDSLNGKQCQSKSGEHDDVSMNSLTEFEKLERECSEAERAETAHGPNTRLSEIEEGHESQTSETSQETLSDTGKGEYADSCDEDFELRLSEFGDMIKSTQSTAEGFDDSISVQHKDLSESHKVESHLYVVRCVQEKTSITTESASSGEEIASQRALQDSKPLVRGSERSGREFKDSKSVIIAQSTCEINPRVLERDGHSAEMETISSSSSDGNVLREASLDYSSQALIAEEYMKAEDVDQDSLREDKSMKPDSLSGDENCEYEDSLHDDKSEDVDSLQEGIRDELNDSLHEKKPPDDDSLHDMDMLPDESSLSLESSLAAVIDVSHDSLSEKVDVQTVPAEHDFDTDSLTGLNVGSTLESAFIPRGCEIIVVQTQRTERTGDTMVSSTDSLEQSISAGTHVTHQTESESLMSSSLNSAQTLEDCTMISSTDTVEPEILTHSFGKPSGNIRALSKEEKQKYLTDSEGNIPANDLKTLMEMEGDICTVLKQQDSETSLHSKAIDIRTCTTAMKFGEEGVKNHELSDTLNRQRDQADSRNQSEEEFTFDSSQYSDPEMEIEEVSTVDEHGNTKIIRTVKRVIHMTQKSPSCDTENVEERLKEFLKKHGTEESTGKFEEDIKEERSVDPKGNVVVIRTVHQQVTSDPVVYCKSFSGEEAQKLSDDFIKSYEVASTESVREYENIDEDGNVVRFTHQTFIKPEVRAVSFSGPNARKEMEDFMKQSSEGSSGTAEYLLQTTGFCSEVQELSVAPSEQMAATDGTRIFPEYDTSQASLAEAFSGEKTMPGDNADPLSMKRNTQDVPEEQSSISATATVDDTVAIISEVPRDICTKTDDKEKVH